MHRTWVAVATITVVLTGIVGSTTSAAIDWRAEVPIAHTNAGTFHIDASYGDKLSVIAWQVAGDVSKTLRVAISADGGRGDFTTRRVGDDVVGMAVAACGHDALVAYRERKSDSGLRLRLARIPSDGGAITRVTVRPSVPARGSLDVACGSGRATVAWTERVGASWHALVRHARLDDLARTPMEDLGVAYPARVAAAASDDRAYVAWANRSGLHLERFVIGAEPVFAVRPRPPQRLTAVGRDPMLTADGGQVAVGYTSASDPEVRVSRDGGVTFPRIWGYGLDPGDSSFLSLALEGRRIVGTVEFTYLDFEPFFHRLTSADLGRRWNHRRVGQGVVDPIDGLLVMSTGPKLAETFIRASGDTGGWELVFHRER